MSNELKNEMDDSRLEGISGGVLFNAAGIIGADPNNPWEVLDDKTGNVIARFPNRHDALAATGKFSENHMEITWDQVQQLRGLK